MHSSDLRKLVTHPLWTVLVDHLTEEKMELLSQMRAVAGRPDTLGYEGALQAIDKIINIPQSIREEDVARRLAKEQERDARALDDAEATLKADGF